MAMVTLARLRIPPATCWEEATYNAFGETVAEGGDMKTAYRFRGQQGFATDPRTGDVSFASRNYSPNLGRWLSSSEFGAAGAYFPTLFARDEQRRLPEESLGGCNAAEALCIRKAVDLINSRLANSPLWPLGKKLPDGATKSQVCESKLRECVIETLRYIQFSCKDSGTVRDGNLLEYCGADKKRGEGTCYCNWELCSGKDSGNSVVPTTSVRVWHN